MHFTTTYVVTFPSRVILTKDRNMACHNYDVVACYFGMLMINEMYWLSYLLSFDWYHIWRHLLCSKLFASCISLFNLVQSLDRLACLGDNYDRWFSRDPLQVVLCRRPCLAVLAWAGMLTLYVVHPAFPLPTTALPTLQGALKDGFGEAVVACDMPEPCKFPSLDSCQKSFRLKFCVFDRLKIQIIW